MKKIKEKGEILSQRELQILKLVSEGKTNAQIGREMNISPYTVKAHLNIIFDKFGVHDRVSAVVKAMRKKLL